MFLGHLQTVELAKASMQDETLAKAGRKLLLLLLYAAGSLRDLRKREGGNSKKVMRNQPFARTA